jgi:diguanylate cyclase (GGDEF)-like protein
MRVQALSASQDIARAQSALYSAINLQSQNADMTTVRQAKGESSHAIEQAQRTLAGLQTANLLIDAAAVADAGNGLTRYALAAEQAASFIESDTFAALMFMTVAAEKYQRASMASAALQTAADQAAAVLEQRMTALMSRDLVIIPGSTIVAIVLSTAASIYFGRVIARPIVAMSDAMRRLAEGELSIAIPATEQNDEVGQMAQAMVVFRANAEEARARAEERVRAAELLHTQQQRFDIAAQNMVQGLLMIDDDRKVVVANRRFCELWNVPVDSVIAGMPYDAMHASIAAHGNLSLEDVTQVRRLREEAIRCNARKTFLWELSDGRAISVTHQPMAGGWTTTYEDVTERRTTEARIAHMARDDALTDLPNRVLFHEALEHALAFARRGRLLALHCLDLDQFKSVNDTLGHPIGDRLLQAVAQQLRDAVRGADTVARLGGDEFAIVQSALQSPHDATALASRLVEMLALPFEIDGHQITIGTSIGIAFGPADGTDADELMKNADLALYRAKLEGRGMYRLFHSAMDAEMQARRLLELDLRHALQRGEFELFYQPLIDLHTETAGGFEALLRWRHPDRGIVPPDKFIPLAEEIGAIVPIGEWVLRHACLAAASWPDDLRVSVNLSPTQFKVRDLVGTVGAALQDSGLAPDRLELEITETVMLQDTAATLATLHDLRNLGVRIAMDDFGTGYSSLSYLRCFPFDRIKIDQSFIRELGRQRDSGAIVRAVIALGRELGMATTAEGVETPEQLRALAEAGCSDIQGYLFIRPVPLKEIPFLLKSMPTAGALLQQAAMDEEVAVA